MIGSGVAGLTAGYVLARTDDVTLFEADGRIGGHAHTHQIPWPDGRELAQAAMFAPGLLGAAAVAGGLIWLSGLAFEAVGDWQLTRFKGNPAQSGPNRTDRRPAVFTVSSKTSGRA